MDIDYDINDNSDCDEACDPSDCHAYHNQLELSAVHTNGSYPYPEVKIRDQGIGSPGNSLAASLIGAVVCYNDDIVAGAQNAQMLGNQVSIKSISWNFIPTIPAATSGTPGALRYSLVWDRQPNGVMPTYADIYASTGTAFILNMFSHTNFNNRQRFVILKTWYYPTPLNGSSNCETGKLSINMLSTFINPQPTPAVPITGALLGTACTTNATGATLFGFIRVRYYDN